MENFGAFKDTIQNYLEGKGAGSEQEAADFFSAECAAIINAATNSLIMSEAPTPPGFCSGDFLTAFNSIKSSGVNTPANWLPVATAWGTEISSKAYVGTAGGAVLMPGGSLGVPPASTLLAQAFSTAGEEGKSASEVASDFRDAIETCCGLATGTHTVAGTPPVVQPITGLS